MEPEDNKPSKGYGKRSTRQWVVIYLVVAAVVYFLIWLFFIKGDGNSSTGGGLY